MRSLIAISSCYDFEKNGNNAALRETWLPCVGKYPNLEYRFFFGTGQGAESADLLGDCVLLEDVPDGYGFLSYKTQASLRWAHERDFDFCYRCFPDTYCCVDRLVTCGFEAYSYCGDFRGESASHGNYASGGPGYWLSREAFSLLIDAPILGVWQDEITVWAEDLWVGQILKNYPSLTYKDDWARFVNHGGRYFPTRGNGVISSHLSHPGPYNKALMFAAHNSYLNS